MNERWLGWCMLSGGLLFGAILCVVYDVLLASIPLGILGVCAGFRAYKEDCP
jgi:hypothetical protein